MEQLNEAEARAEKEMVRAVSYAATPCALITAPDDDTFIPVPVFEVPTLPDEKIARFRDEGWEVDTDYTWDGYFSPPNHDDQDMIILRIEWKHPGGLDTCAIRFEWTSDVGGALVMASTARCLAVTRELKEEEDEGFFVITMDDSSPLDELLQIRLVKEVAQGGRGL